MYQLMKCVMLLFIITLENTSAKKSLEEEEYGVKFATDCEVCKLVTKEIGIRLQSTDSSDVIETGYNMDSKKKKTKYNKSELRLLETLEDVCGGMNDYRVHKERHDSTRWAKMMSQTFETLHNLVNKGVKVELGIPYELWDDPSAEVAQLKTQCEQFVEDNEEGINNWYFDTKSSEPLQMMLCPELLKDSTCLSEPYGETIPSPGKEPVDNNQKQKKLNVGSTKSEL